MAEGVTKRHDNPLLRLADTVAEQLQSDIILINSPMEPGLDDRLRKQLPKERPAYPNVIVILVTSGGIADCAYSSARILQDYYDQFTVCISGWCKSAGTLFAIGAHKLIFGEEGQLGPLDVQVVEKDEIGNRNSGLVAEAAFESLQRTSFEMFEKFMMQIKARSGGSVTFKTAADLASKMTIGLMAPIFEQIDPIRLGEDARSQKIGESYAIRLDLKARNLKGQNQLDMLLNGYPSHSFLIDREEAGWLFNSVDPLEGTLKELVDHLGLLAKDPREHEPIVWMMNGLNNDNETESDDADEGNQDSQSDSVEGETEQLQAAE
ncbi:hypothetical protein [Pedomonas sp. V897]|uniref:hypothetical protein n=1 Tax=Pedomonas sp. V897 TaxID=3446482 RepID=UPI003EE091A2